ncbi:MAG: phage holin [Ruminococcus sp.]|nr:phage holin [Ruminococcus sp.]
MDKGLIVRLVFFIVSMINTILTVSGINPLAVSDSDIYQFVSVMVTVVISVWTMWKNNNFTPAARMAQIILDKIKSGEISSQRLQAYLKDK